MTTPNEPMQAHHKAIMEHLDTIHEKTTAYVNSAGQHAQEQIKNGNVKEVAETLNKMADSLTAKNNVVVENLSKRTANFKQAFAASPTPAASLPKGLSNGKVAAVIAGVGLVTIGALALHRHKNPRSSSSWVDRVTQHPSPQQGRGL